MSSRLSVKKQSRGWVSAKKKGGWKKSGVGQMIRRAALPGALRSGRHELKSVDVPTGVVLCNTTAVITPLNLIRAGSSFNNRVGRKIEMISLRLVGQMVSVRTTVAQDYNRIMLVYDRQTNGALPAIADILQATDQAGTNTTDSFTGINLNNRDRFVILRDEHLCMPTQTQAAGTVITNPGGQIDPVSTTFKLDWYVKLKGLVAQFKADSAPAVIGDISTGGLYLVTFGDNVAGTEGWALETQTRLRYLDL